MSRRISREEAFKVLFELNFQGVESLSEVLEYYYENLCVPQLEKDYFENVLHGVCEHMVEIEEYIAKYSIKWAKHRISKVSMSVMWIAIYEILYIEDIPSSVSANEAVELAKKYEGPESAAFINGIIGTIIKTIEESSKEAE